MLSFILAALSPVPAMLYREAGALVFFIKSVAIGFAIAAPVGPVGMLCIRRSLAEGPRIGLATGLGAATADAMFGCVAAFGLSAVSSFLVQQQLWLSLLGGGYLCYLGLGIFFSRPPAPSEALGNGSVWRAYASTVFLTLANPITILSFIAMFAGFRLGASWDYQHASVLVLGVLAGSALWWLMLSLTAGAVRTRLNGAGLRIINRISGSFLFGFGLYALSRLMRG